MKFGVFLGRAHEYLTLNKFTNRKVLLYRSFLHNVFSYFSFINIVVIGIIISQATALVEGTIVAFVIIALVCLL